MLKISVKYTKCFVRYFKNKLIKLSSCAAGPFYLKKILPLEHVLPLGYLQISGVKLVRTMTAPYFLCYLIRYLNRSLLKFIFTQSQSTSLFFCQIPGMLQAQMFPSFMSVVSLASFLLISFGLCHQCACVVYILYQCECLLSVLCILKMFVKYFESTVQ